MRVIATIEDPRVVRRILTHLGLMGDEGPPPWTHARARPRDPVAALFPPARQTPASPDGRRLPGPTAA